MKKIWILAALYLSFRATVQAAAPTADDYYKAAAGLYAKQQYDLAIRYYQAAVQADPGHWQAYQALGTAFYQKKDYRNASAYFDKSLSLHPDNPQLKKFNDQLKAAHTEWAQVPVSVPDARPAATPVPTPSPTPLPEGPGAKKNLMEERIGWGNSFWSRAYLGLNSCGMGDLGIAAQAWNSYFKGYTTSATVQTTGFTAGAESGLILDAHDTISLSADVLINGNYKAHVNNNYGSSIDQEVDPIFLGAEANYYRYFLLDFGRIFVGAGAGLGMATVHYVFSPSGAQGTDVHFTGEGFVGSGQLGGELYLNRKYSLEFSVKGRYAQIPRVTGTAKDQYGNTGSAALLRQKNGLLIADFETNVSNYGYTYVPLDFSGFDLRLALDYYF